MKANQILHRANSCTAPTPFKSNPPLRILVVDDDIFIRHPSTAVLSRSGYEVDTAEDGAVAGQALTAANYDLVITDSNILSNSRGTRPKKMPNDLQTLHGPQLFARENKTNIVNSSKKKGK